jgi:hypothetical protein
MIAFEIEVLNKRKYVNQVVRHIQALNQLISDLENRNNLADLLNDLINSNVIEAFQVSPILNTVLIDKYNYEVYSHNMEDNLSNFKDLTNEMAKWNAIDIVIAYYHPELGLKVINPKRLEQWEAIQSLKKNELITIYLGGSAHDVNDKLKAQALEKCIQLLQGKKVSAPPDFTKGRYTVKKLAQKVEKKEAPPAKKKAQAVRAPVKEKKKAEAAPPTGQRRMTPLYSIPVTNELFHNGNVEAWKKVIESYTTRYAGSDVYIFYEGERIHDVNTLFKWGKVKHGSSILIAVAGDNIQDVAKLRRYLKQGASPMFEAFLRFPVNQVLKLF